MADTSAAEIPKALAQQIQPMQSPLPSSTPMEMTTLGEQVEVVGDNLPGAGSSASHSNALAPPVSSSEATGDGSQDGELGASYVKPTANTNIPSQVLAGTSISSAVGQSIMHPDTLTREKTAPAIGPSSDKPVPSPKESEIVGPVLMITLLLINGVRHFYKFDEKYLKKRNLNVEGNNPINMSTYTLKELIWKEWREEWEARPSSPSSIRLIYYGKLLDDKLRLEDCKFVVGPTPHVVHMTIKPQDIVDEEDAKLAKSAARDRDGSGRSPRCRCVIL